MPSKPAEYGIKIWMMADCESFYVSNLEVYLQNVVEKPEKNQSARVELDLVKCLD